MVLVIPWYKPTHSLSGDDDAATDNKVNKFTATWILQRAAICAYCLLSCVSLKVVSKLNMSKAMNCAACGRYIYLVV